VHGPSSPVTGHRKEESLLTTCKHEGLGNTEGVISFVGWVWNLESEWSFCSRVRMVARELSFCRVVVVFVPLHEGSVA
jgi:hypothetical protein